MIEENKNNPDSGDGRVNSTEGGREGALGHIVNDIVEEIMEDAMSDDSDEAEVIFEEETEKGPGDSEEPDEKKETKKLFGKKKHKKDKKDEKIEELSDQLKRQMAEFDNFRKRTNQEKSSMYIIGAKEIVEKMLPIVDSFERGLAAVPKENQEDPFVDGMNKVYKQLMTALEEAGVQPIEAVGQEFNPDLHNAVMHIESDEAEDNTVVEEFQKGYLYKDFVVRHSMVKVAN